MAKQQALEEAPSLEENGSLDITIDGPSFEIYKLRESIEAVGQLANWLYE